jgi:NAD(P)-dependent dehydrogenase (short-subunit alcohol dehydrogenase family)
MPGTTSPCMSYRARVSVALLKTCPESGKWESYGAHHVAGVTLRIHGGASVRESSVTGGSSHSTEFADESSALHTPVPQYLNGPGDLVATWSCSLAFMTKNVVITGANRGLGLALARAYIANGHHVFGGCRTPDAATELQALGAEVLHFDAADFASIDAFVASIGDRVVDTVINSAGVDARAFGAEDTNRSALTISAEHFEAVMRVNVTAPLLLVERLGSALLASKGTVVNISSQIGSLTIAQSMSRDVSYAASKAALNMVTAKQAQLFAGRGVTAITLHPGWLRTDMGGTSADLDPNDAAIQILATVEALTHDQNGHFLRYDGTTHPW